MERLIFILGINDNPLITRVNMHGGLSSGYNYEASYPHEDIFGLHVETVLEW